MPNLTVGPEEGPFKTREPENNGGGEKVSAPPGSYISAIQIGQEGGSQRYINVWYRKLTIE
ncbi:hypothetical protein QCM80_09325 [Bradyrhizobium sp. SSUT112]|uniref:hypothetical protein n=1 Tax=Bradyrhizobium sp. SSUT112 TaxID=3040604 RepID=UPI00244A44BC|nr:hypothetical protein [Bradyrhizobium sp. SSUT112]MDH2350867.1 hypothetical protein [Bradyrhizobium sp. SSUT112]